MHSENINLPACEPEKLGGIQNIVLAKIKDQEKVILNVGVNEIKQKDQGSDIPLQESINLDAFQDKKEPVNRKYNLSDHYQNLVDLVQKHGGTVNHYFSQLEGEYLEIKGLRVSMTDPIIEELKYQDNFVCSHIYNGFTGSNYYDVSFQVHIRESLGYDLSPSY